MFTKILQWIKELINKMIGQSSIKQALSVDVAISADMANALQLWSNMYLGKAPWVTGDIYSMNLPAAIAGEIARATTIEMQVEISGSSRAKYLTDQFALVLPKLRTMIEYGAAKGGIMFKPYPAGKNIHVDYVQADQFYPVSFDANGNIVSCIFADQRTIGQSFYTRLEYHQMTLQGCLIRNMAFKSSSQDTLGMPVSLESVEAWKDLQPEALITGVDKPLYAYFKFPLANAIDPTSPLGVSCYSRAVKLIQSADEQWSNLLWEFDSGKRALYVDSLAFGKDKDNKPILPNKRLYRTLNSSGAVDDEDMFREWTPDLREQNILNGLDAILKEIEFTCGLEYGTLSNPEVAAKTATEIKMAKQRTYATITDTQKALQVALEQLIWAMDTWATIYNLAPAGTYQTSYEFDDSVVADHDVQFTQDSQAVGMQVMSKVEFRMRTYGETEEVARQKIEMVTAEIQPNTFFNENNGK